MTESPPGPEPSQAPAVEQRESSHPRDALLTSFGSVTSAVLAGAASILIARELGVDARGEWAAIFALATLVATLAGLGLPPAAGYAAARVSRRERAGIVEAALWASIALGLLAAIAYLVTVRIATPSDASDALVAAGAGIALLTVLQNVTQQIVLTASSLRWFVAAQVVSAAAAFVAVAVLALAGELDLWAVVLVFIARALFASAISIVALRRHRVIQRERSVESPRRVVHILRPYLAYALLTFGIVSLATVVQRVDVLLVEGIRGSRDAGLYAVGIQVIDLLLIVPGALGFIAFRGAARSAPDHWRDTLRTLRWVLVLQLVCGALIFAYPADLLGLVFGDEYEAGAAALRWLVPAAVLLSLQAVISNYVAGRGRPRSVLIAWGAGAVIGVGVNLAVIPAYGIEGAAATLSLAYFVILVLHLHAFYAVRPSSGAETDGEGR